MVPIEQTLTVFSVDDSEIVYKSIKTLLLETKNILWAGHALSLHDACLLIDKKNPNVVILDIQLREESGFEFLKYLSKNHPAIVVIMFSNLSSMPYREKAMELGAKYFLDKSTEFEKIPEILTELINNMPPVHRFRLSI